MTGVDEGPSSEEIWLGKATCSRTTELTNSVLSHDQVVNFDHVDTCRIMVGLALF